MQKTAATLDAQMLEMMRILEVSLRSGYSLVQALDIVARDMAEPAAGQAQQVVTAVQAGKPMLEVLEAWRRNEFSRDLDLLVAVIVVQLEVGGNLADKLQLMQQVMAKRRVS